MFRADIKRVVVEVDAMPGVPVHFYQLKSGVRPWDITRVNLRRIFGPGIEEVVVPEGEADVGHIATADNRFTSEELVALSERHRQPAKPDEVRFHVMFLAGGFEEDGGIRASVEGAQVGGTRALALFPRDDVEDPDVAAVLQQLAVLHELGHAMGLVDLPGTPSVVAHGRPGDPAHCRVSDCVMRQRGGGPEQVFRLLGPEIQSREELLVFGPACLGDLARRRSIEQGLP